MIDLSTKRIVVTGGAGFLGKHLIRRLKKRVARISWFLSRANTTLRALTRSNGCLTRAGRNPDSHGGSCWRYRRESGKPGRFFYENAIMGIQLIEAARSFGVEKTVVLGTICAYPKFTPVPFHEECAVGWLSGGDQCALWTGEEDDAGAMPVLSRAIRNERRLSFAGEPLWPAATISTWTLLTSFPR